MLKKKIMTAIATAVLITGVSVWGPTVAQATDDSRAQAVSALKSPSREKPLELHGVAAAGSKKVYKCTVTPHKPHLSVAELKKKRNSVVAKATVTCPNADKSLKVNVYGVLAKSTSKKISTLRIIDSVSTVVTVKKGGKQTVMVPAAKSKTHHAPGKKGMWFRAAFSAKISGEGTATTNSGASDHVWLKNKKF